jgi:hypothetical protein
MHTSSWHLVMDHPPQHARTKGEPAMPVVKVTRAGVRSAPREVPTDTTAAVLPLTIDRVGREAPEDELPVRVASLADAFAKFTPRLHFRTTIADGAEFEAELEFRSLRDFDPRQIRAREPGKRNDLADLQSRIEMLHRMRERFSVLSVKRAWENDEQRRQIVGAVAELQGQIRRIAAPRGEA